MTLQFKDLTLYQDDFSKINALYHRAFPDDERAPIQYLLQKAQEHQGEFLGIYADTKWVGLAYVITYQQLSYVFYLAIDDSQRGKGYGSQTLQLLKKRYLPSLMLCIEEVDPKYDNYLQRVKRKEFYLRNGLKEMNFYYDEANVRYEMLYANQKKSAKDYDALMINFVGERYNDFRDYTKDVQK